MNEGRIIIRTHPVFAEDIMRDIVARMPTLRNKYDMWQSTELLSPNLPPVLPCDFPVDSIVWINITGFEYYQPGQGGSDMSSIVNLMKHLRQIAPEKQIWYCSDDVGTMPLMYENDHMGSWVHEYVSAYKRSLGMDAPSLGFADLPNRPSDLTTHKRYNKRQGVDVNLNVESLVATVRDNDRTIARIDRDGVLVNKTVLQDLEENEILTKIVDEVTGVLYRISNVLEEDNEESS